MTSTEQKQPFWNIPRPFWNRTRPFQNKHGCIGAYGPTKKYDDHHGTETTILEHDTTILEHNTTIAEQTWMFQNMWADQTYDDQHGT